jgi:hypothetical protein
MMKNFIANDIYSQKALKTAIFCFTSTNLNLKKHISFYFIHVNLFRTYTKKLF